MLGDSRQSAAEVPMRISHANELAELETTYGRYRSPEHHEVTRIGKEISRGTTLFVGSGGMLAAARLSAELHVSTMQQPAWGVTPLQAVALVDAAESVVLLSARAKHPDVLAAAQNAKASGSRVILLTFRNASELPARLLNCVDSLVTLTPAVADGFLATNSVLAFAM